MPTTFEKVEYRTINCQFFQKAKLSYNEDIKKVKFFSIKKYVLDERGQSQ